MMGPLRSSNDALLLTADDETTTTRAHPSLTRRTCHSATEKKSLIKYYHIAPTGLNSTSYLSIYMKYAVVPWLYYFNIILQVKAASSPPEIGSGRRTWLCLNLLDGRGNREGKKEEPRNFRCHLHLFRAEQLSSRATTFFNSTTLRCASIVFLQSICLIRISA